jgi:hypothetical protein
MDHSDDPMMWSFQRDPIADTVTWEVMTKNGHYVLKNLTSDAWDALRHDMAVADARGDSVEPVLESWVGMME